MYTKDTLRVKFVNDARNYNDVLNNLILNFEELYSYIDKLGYADVLLSGDVDIVGLFSIYRVSPHRIKDYLENYRNSKIENVEVLEFSSKLK